MIRNIKLWEQFEAELAEAEIVDPRHNMYIFEELYKQACSMGILPPEDPLEGIEHVITLARALNFLKPLDPGSPYCPDEL